MRIVRCGLVIGLVVAAAACGGDDAATTTLGPTTTVTRTSPSITTSPPTGPSTTESVTTTTSTSPDTATTPTPTATAPTTATTESPPPTTEPPTADVKVYFMSGERLAIAHRQVAGPAVLRAALTELLRGPTTDERDAGISTTIPVDVTLLDVALAGGTATVDLSDDYAAGGGSLMMSARVAQVVFTATQFDDVDDVVFRLDGAPIEFLSGEGLELIGPQTRSTTDRALTGGVLIDEPRPGATVTSPFVLTGEGDVFEGDFPVVFRRDGVDVAGPFVVVAGAWGTWADFRTTITLDLAPGPIELVATDGTGCEPTECTPIEIVVPLTLE